MGRLYPPHGLGGAEWTVHEFLLALRRQGHEAVFYHDSGRHEYEYEGVPVVARPPARADYLVGHLNSAHRVLRAAGRAQARLGWMAHAENQWAWCRSPVDVQFANSEHVQRAMPGSLLLRPHVPDGRYGGKNGKGRGSQVTLVNLIPEKGVELFREIARLLPDVHFLGVRGGYGSQTLRQGRYGNLTVWDTQVDMTLVYAATRILLMPSSVESWGRVAVEAAWRSIPTLTTATPGAREAMGDAAIYLPSDRPDLWAAEIQRLLTNTTYYTAAGARARRRAVALQRETLLDMDRVVKHLEATLRTGTLVP